MLTDAEWRAESAGIETGFVLAVELLEAMGVGIDRPALLAAAGEASRDEGPLDSTHQRGRRGAVLRTMAAARRLLARLPRGWAAVRSEPACANHGHAGSQLNTSGSHLPA